MQYLSQKVPGEKFAKNTVCVIHSVFAAPLEAYAIILNRV